MKHYWVLGVLGVGFYGIYEFSRSNLWFQHADRMEHATGSRSQDFHWSGALGAGDVIEIKGINGSVVAHAHDGHDVVVRASKTARKSDVSSVRVEVVEHREGVTICAVYPSRERSNACAPGEQGRLNSNRNDVNVNFDVQVPSGVTFVGKTVNGGVTAVELKGPIEAHTVNGEIEVSASGYLSAETVNGNIEASLLGTALTDEVSLQTVNGSLTLALPQGIDADVFGATTNGQIRSEFPLTIQGRFGPKRFEGVIGDGGEDIRLESLNGTISVIRRNR